MEGSAQGLGFSSRGAGLAPEKRSLGLPKQGGLSAVKGLRAVWGLAGLLLRNLN